MYDIYVRNLVAVFNENENIYLNIYCTFQIEF